jgi:hypothetical protein
MPLLNGADDCSVSQIESLCITATTPIAEYYTQNNTTNKRHP